ncbi:hypothetical protein GCM10022631_22100 [Deinococcus rubellus]|uniref:Uncharacterized protein n=1 Tax=Deinococcus rubellus TaxID=1889240 RepID=A0ABY5YGU5_9DEIO|nr:hypothetical protein [Deinococcus rubellus]UWX64293.1 hypothetical protein N0D28_01050 [Deinococcus rubellus]
MISWLAIAFKYIDLYTTKKVNIEDLYYKGDVFLIVLVLNATLMGDTATKIKKSTLARAIIIFISFVSCSLCIYIYASSDVLKHDLETLRFLKFISKVLVGSIIILNIVQILIEGREQDE